MNARDSIKSMMQKRKIRQSELARRLGVGRSTVSNQISGMRYDLKDGSKYTLTVDTLLRYVNVLGYRLVLVPMEKYDEVKGGTICIDEMGREKGTATLEGRLN